VTEKIVAAASSAAPAAPVAPSAAPVAPLPSLVQKMDIGNSKYVRPDVFHFVDDNIGQIASPRRSSAPSHHFEPSKSG
jgi:hypothetical protein